MAVFEKGTRKRPRRRTRSQQELKVIPLGGLGEIGKNLTVLEYGDDLLVVDCGLKFPDEEMLGIDFVIPDAQYLFENKERIRGLVLTHGHEDHIGGLPFILPKIDVPVYGSRLALGLVAGKIAEARPEYKPKLVEVQAQDSVKLGVFTVSFVPVCHSIPDSFGLAIETPLGFVVHTGDFKFDATPIDGRLTDYSAFAELGRKGVLLMLSDSTNVEREGYTPSEREVGRTFEQLFRLYKDKRIVIATFASNIHRSQQVFDVASRFNRKVALLGRSMIADVELARQLGYIKVDDDRIVPLQEAEQLPPNRMVVLTTGSQGEPFSGLVLMSKGEHRQIKLGPKDLIIISATPIPGNEKLVSRTINLLFAKGCEVIYERSAQIHVSGHASREELKMMMSLVRPRWFLPVHGEYRHLMRHAQLAREMGIVSKNVFVLQNGDVLSLTREKATLKGQVPAGAVLVDGMALGEFEGSLLKERRELSEDGIIVISMAIDENYRLLSPLLIESRGFLHTKEAKDLYESIELAVKRVLESHARGREKDPEALGAKIRSKVRDILGRYSRTSPTILPLINRISGK